jgi:hypothetical protein
VTLTSDGKRLLDAYRTTVNGQPDQQYHAGFVKPREIAHDAHMYALYRTEAGRVEAEGGRVVRVVLDYELKREYQAFLNRRDRPEEESVQEARDVFAAVQKLPIVDGHLELPDVRIEYETADGQRESRDLELVTEHYSRAQLAGKARSGFTAYRSSAGQRAVGGTSRTGGTPYDPHYLEWLG